MDEASNSGAKKLCRRDKRLRTVCFDQTLACSITESGTLIVSEASAA